MWGTLKDGRHSLGSLRAFARLAFLFYSATFVLGLVIYPTYKVKVRVGYFEKVESPRALSSEQADAGIRAQSTGQGLPPDHSHDLKLDSGRTLVRLFDIKEHMAFLGWLSMALCFVGIRYWDEGVANAVYSNSMLALAGMACFATWWSGVVGLIVSASRSIAAL